MSFLRFPVRPRRGFTLVELLVVIAIIGVLVALLLPAVQAAREAARRMQCSNKLKQIGLALHNYHDTILSFPYGSTYAATAPATNHTWVELLLPYIEQSALHGNLNFSQPNNHADNVELVGLKLDFLSCPSNPRTNQQFPNGATVWDGGFAHQGLDYPLCAGTMRPDGTTPDCTTEPSFCISEDSNTQSWGTATRIPPGCFSRNIYAPRMADITDGTSNTFLAGERLAQGCNWGGAFSVNFPIAFMGQKPNSPTRSTDRNDYRRNCGFSSQHPSGLNMLLGDASVRLIPATIDFTVWSRTGDKADGNVVALP